MKARVAAKQARRLDVHIPSIRSLTRKNCPAGMVPRKAYVRKYSTPVRKAGIKVTRKGKTYISHPSSKSMLVKSKCIRAVGAPASRRSEARFGPLRKGELTKLGYSSKYPEEQRHIALQKAVLKYGALGVFRKLDAVAKLTVHSIPAASAVYVRDRAWIQRAYGPLKAN
jgi:hypothetical protein